MDRQECQSHLWVRTQVEGNLGIPSIVFGQTFLSDQTGKDACPTNCSPTLPSRWGLKAPVILDLTEPEVKVMLAKKPMNRLTSR